MKARSDVELLAELEKEVVELQTTIAVIKRRIGTSSNNGAGAHAALSVAVHDDIKVQDKPFLGMSILKASQQYLQRVREPKSVPIISEALRSGGVHSRSTDFADIVRTTISRKGGEVGIESFGNGTWGLTEWRPGRTRAAAPATSDD